MLPNFMIDGRQGKTCMSHNLFIIALAQRGNIGNVCST